MGGRTIVTLFADNMPQRLSEVRLQGLSSCYSFIHSTYINGMPTIGQARFKVLGIQLYTNWQALCFHGNCIQAEKGKYTNKQAKEKIRVIIITWKMPRIKMWSWEGELRGKYQPREHSRQKEQMRQRPGGRNERHRREAEKEKQSVQEGG